MGRSRHDSFEPIELQHEGLHAGIDEAGRGCLAGPLAVGVVVFPKPFFENPLPDELSFLDDSKKLTPKRREALIAPIHRYSLFSGVVFVSSRLIDRIGINPATEFAMIRALKRNAALPVDRVLIDGNYRFSNLKKEFSRIDFESIIGGDGKSITIAAASILAKVARDRRMCRLDSLFPDYGFALHKGYGTELHRKAIRVHGPTPLHRRSYRW